MRRFDASKPDVPATEAASESLIDRHSHFDGEYTTSHDLRIEGTAEGTIRCEGTVTIAEAARVSATVNARNVILAGSAHGEIVCHEHFLLRPSGEMRGRVQAASLSVEEGAFFEGEFHMAEPGQRELDSPADWYAWRDDESDLDTTLFPDSDLPTATEAADEVTVEEVDESEDMAEKEIVV